MYACIGYSSLFYATRTICTTRTMKTLYRVEKIKLDVLISLGNLYWLTSVLRSY